MRTSMSFIRRLVCTMAEALSMKLRNITLLRGTSRASASKQSAMSGAQKKSMMYMAVAMARLNHSTVE